MGLNLNVHIATLGIWILLMPFSRAFQNLNPGEVNYQDFTYEEFQYVQDSLYETDNLSELDKVIRFHTEKAKLENNDIEIARSLFYKTIIGADSTRLKYADSIINITLGSDHKRYPTAGYVMRAKILFQQGKYDLALQNYLEAYNLALKKKSDIQIQNISFDIAAIRNMNGQSKEALQMYHKSLSKLKLRENFKTDFYEDYILLLNNIALSHLRLKELDSAAYYTKLGFNITNRLTDKKSNIDFKMVAAQIDFYSGNYKKSIDSITRYIENYSGTDEAIKRYYIGKSYEKLNQEEKAIESYLRIDSITEKTDEYFDEMREVYQSLITYANVQDEDEMQLDYIEKLLYADSLLTAQKKEVFNNASFGYDLPLLKIQKDEITEKLYQRSRWNLILIYSVIVAIVGLVIFLFRERRIKSKIKLLLKKVNEDSKMIEKPVDNEKTIPDEKASDILSKLMLFEKNHDFLDKNLDLPTLSEKLETNTSYLSMVINTHKKMSFPNYLKKLRIDHALKRLSTDTELLKYNYQGLAEIFGFKSPESFSRAFNAQNGVYPSHVVKELKKKAKKDYL